jgi:hypothetical protein
MSSQIDTDCDGDLKESAGAGDMAMSPHSSMTAQQHHAFQSTLMQQASNQFAFSNILGQVSAPFFINHPHTFDRVV